MCPTPDSLENTKNQESFKKIPVKTTNSLIKNKQVALLVEKLLKSISESSLHD